jgi:hypothetical protein
MRTIYGKLTSEKSGKGREDPSERQQWVINSFRFLDAYIKRTRSRSSSKVCNAGIVNIFNNKWFRIRTYCLLTVLDGTSCSLLFNFKSTVIACCETVFNQVCRISETEMKSMTDIMHAVLISLIFYVLVSTSG